MRRVGLWYWVAGLATILTVSGCSASMEALTGSTQSIASSSSKPYYETATTEAAKGRISTPRPNGAVRAYSGLPDGASRERIDGMNGILDMPGVQAYLQRVLDKLLDQWPYAPPRLGLFIANSQAYEAHATAAGDLLIASGMLESLESEDELAAILAHEISHVLLDHFQRSEQVADNKRALNTVANAAITYFLFSNTDWRRTANGWSGTANMQGLVSDSLKAGGACLAVTYLTDKVFDPGWQRQQEDEADLLGVDLMVRAGYDPKGAVKALERRVAFESGVEKSRVARRSKDGEYDRIVQDSIKQNGLAGAVTGIARSVGAGVVDTLSDLDDQISQRHKQTGLRLSGLQLYISRHYGDRERKALMEAPYRRHVLTGKAKQTFENFKHAAAVQGAILANDLPKAMHHAKLALRPPTQSALVPRMAMYGVLSAMGQEEAAFQQLLAVKNRTNAPPPFFRALADGYNRRGDKAMAEKMYEEAHARRRSVYDKEMQERDNGLLSLLSPQPKSGENRFDVSGYCENVRNAVSSTATSISGGKI